MMDSFLEHSKMFFLTKQNTPNFPKNEHFLMPDAYTYVCLSGGKKYSFFRKFRVLFSRYLSFEIWFFVLLPRRVHTEQFSFSQLYRLNSE